MTEDKKPEVDPFTKALRRIIYLEVQIDDLDAKLKGHQAEANELYDSLLDQFTVRMMQNTTMHNPGVHKSRTFFLKPRTFMQWTDEATKIPMPEKKKLPPSLAKLVRPSTVTKLASKKA